METQNAKPHMSVKFEVFDYRHFPGSNPQKPRPSTKISGTILLPDGGKTYAEFFLDGTHHMQAGIYTLGLRIGADYQKRLSVGVVAFVPYSEKS